MVQFKENLNKKIQVIKYLKSTLSLLKYSVFLNEE
jgi:hypothetical protein